MSETLETYAPVRVRTAEARIEYLLDIRVQNDVDHILNEMKSGDNKIEIDLFTLPFIKNPVLFNTCVNCRELMQLMELHADSIRLYKFTNKYISEDTIFVLLQLLRNHECTTALTKILKHLYGGSNELTAQFALRLTTSFFSETLTIKLWKMTMYQLTNMIVLRDALMAQIPERVNEYIVTLAGESLCHRTLSETMRHMCNLQKTSPSSEISVALSGYFTTYFQQMVKHDRYVKTTMFDCFDRETQLTHLPILSLANRAGLCLADPSLFSWELFTMDELKQHSDVLQQLSAVFILPPAYMQILRDFTDQQELLAIINAGKYDDSDDDKVEIVGRGSAKSHPTR